MIKWNYEIFCIWLKIKFFGYLFRNNFNFFQKSKKLKFLEFLNEFISNFIFQNFDLVSQKKKKSRSIESKKL